MNALIRTELLKLRTARSTVLMLAAIAAVGMLQVTRLMRSAGAAGGIHPGTHDAWAQIMGGAQSGTLLVPLLGVLALTGELRHATLSPTLLVSPRRRRVMIAKMAACALTGAAAALATGLLAAGAGLAGGALSGWPARDAVLLMAGGVLLSAFWGWMGVAVGLLVRHQPLALAVPLIWLLAVETLVSAYGLDALRWWLPGGAGAGLAGIDQPGVLPVWLAALVLTAYALALSVPGVRRLVRADIT
jgi:ABC-2 type transport system permease protein